MKSVRMARGGRPRWVWISLLMMVRACWAITEPSEVTALLTIKAAFGNATRLTTWNSTSDPCETKWPGVQCTPASQGGNRHVTGIQLPGNNFNGTLSPAVGNLTSLTLLDLNGNLLKGDMPLEVGQLKQLQRIVVHGNGFTGTLDPWLSKLTNLRIADFSLNHFSGPVPISLGRNLSTLQNLDCSMCSLTGSLPATLGNLSSLQMLSLGGNNLTGSIPSELGSIGGLQLLNLQNNSLSGTVPTELGSLTNLNMMYLAYNDLTGAIPPGILQNPALQARFDGNPLCSSPENAPLCTGPVLPPLGIIHGAPPGFGGPSAPAGGGQNTSAAAPTPVAAAPIPVATNATAIAPAEPPLAAAPSPVNTTGASSLPPTGALPVLSTGSAPAPNPSSGGANQSVPASFSPPPEGGVPNTSLTNPLPAAQKDESSFPVGATVGTVLGGVALLALGALLALLIVVRRRRGDDVASEPKSKALLTSTSSGPIPASLSGSETWSDQFFSLHLGGSGLSQDGMSPKISGDLVRFDSGGLAAPLLFTFRELQNLTNGFDPGRQIGEGGFGKVYWAQAQSQPVAIKRLDKNAAMSARHGEKQFRTEVDVLSRVRHPNLLSLIGYCADGGERALVYPLMQNHSLFHQLHRASEPCPALSSWRQRLTIAAQSASALAYLHDEASPPIIHRDFTSSNVLLNSDWTAVVSDFGLAKLMSKDGAPNLAQSTRLHGTLGYLAPEYLRGHVTEKNDVYSFGVVLLELLSGRQAVVSEDFGLVQWAIDVIDKQAPGLETLLDPAVKDEGDDSIALLEVAVSVARSCVDTDPKRRPRMQDVLQSLLAALRGNSLSEDSSGIVNKPLSIARPPPKSGQLVMTGPDAV